MQVGKAFITINGDGGVAHKIEDEADAQMEVASQKMKIGDLCPERSECGDSVPFGQAEVVNKEGCRGNVRPECYACGYSEC